MDELVKKYNGIVISDNEVKELMTCNDSNALYHFCRYRLEITNNVFEVVPISLLAASVCRSLYRYEESINYINVALHQQQFSEYKEKFISSLFNQMINMCHAHLVLGQWKLSFCGGEIGALEIFRVLDKYFHSHPDVIQIYNRLKGLGVLQEAPAGSSGVAPSDVCLVTSYDDKYAPIGDLCEQTLRKYGEIHGHPCRVVRNYASGRHPMWDKIAIIREMLDEGVPYIFWVDADAMFVRYDQDIAAEIDEEHDLYLTSAWITLARGPGDMLFRESANSGVMLIRNTEWSRRLFADIWDQEAYIDDPLADNSALLHIMGYHGFLGRASFNTPDYALLRRMKFIDFNWNSHPVGSKGNNPIILHYAGVSFGSRVCDMRLQLERTFPKESAAT